MIVSIVHTRRSTSPCRGGGGAVHRDGEDSVSDLQDLGVWVAGTGVSTRLRWFAGDRNAIHTIWNDKTKEKEVTGS